PRAASRPARRAVASPRYPLACRERTPPIPRRARCPCRRSRRGSRGASADPSDPSRARPAASTARAPAILSPSPAAPRPPPRPRLAAVADLLQALVLVDPDLAHPLPQGRLVGKALPVGPRRLARLARLDRRPFAAAEHREIIALADRADVTGNLAAVEIVPCLQRRLHGLRPDHPRVDHALDLEVVHAGEAPAHLVRNVETRDRPAHDRVGLPTP